MSSVQKLFVGNLSFKTSEDDLTSFISEHLPVTSAKIITDRETGRSKGFGFVEVEGDDSSVDDLIKSLSGKDLGGRQVKIDKAKPQENNRGRSGGGHGGGHGGGGRRPFRRD